MLAQSSDSCPEIALLSGAELQAMVARENGHESSRPDGIVRTNTPTGAPEKWSSFVM